MHGTREHILDISSQLFINKGFKDVTMKELVEKSGLSKGAFYHYFENKEQLFLEVINNALVSVEINYDALDKTSLHGFYLDYIDHVMRTVHAANHNPMQTSEGSGWSYYALIMEAFKHIPSFQNKMVESQHTELKAWIKMVDRARDAKEIDATLSNEQIANLFIYTAEGLSIRHIMMGNDAKIGDSLLAFWDSIYSMLKA